MAEDVQVAEVEETAAEQTSEDEVGATYIVIEYLQDDGITYGPLPSYDRDGSQRRSRATLYLNGNEVDREGMWNGFDPEMIKRLAVTLAEVTAAQRLLKSKLGDDKSAW